MNMRIFGTAVLLLSIAACKPSEDATSPAVDDALAGSSPPTAPAEASRADAPGFAKIAQPTRDTRSVDADVVRVRLSNRGDTESHTLGMPTTSFASTDTVYAEVETRGTADAYTIYAKWFAPDGTKLADYGIRIAEAGPKRTVISLSKPDGWAKGQGRIEIAINGELEETVTFEVF